MAQIDVLLAVQLVIVLLIMATLDCSTAPATAAEPGLNEPTPAPPLPWSAETDRHAQRVLRLERQRGATAASIGRESR